MRVRSKLYLLIGILVLSHAALLGACNSADTGDTAPTDESRPTGPTRTPDVGGSGDQETLGAQTTTVPSVTEPLPKVPTETRDAQENPIAESTMTVATSSGEMRSTEVAGTGGTENSSISQPKQTATPVSQPTQTATSVPQPTQTATSVPQPTRAATPEPEPTEESSTASSVGEPYGGKAIGEFASISGGGNHTCAVKTDGAIACWGSNAGQLGNPGGQATPPEGEFASVSAGLAHTCGVRTDGAVACWGSNLDLIRNHQGQATPPSGEFTSVSAGGIHTCGVKTDGAIACWGGDYWGQATPPVGGFTSVSAGGNHTCGMRVDGSVACWGYDRSGQATPPGGEFTSVSAGVLPHLWH